MLFIGSLLFLASFSLNSVIDNAIVNGVSFATVVALLIHGFNRYYEAKFLPLLLLFLSFFDYSAEKGSLWNFASLILMSVLFLTGKISVRVNSVTRILVPLILVFYLLGILLINPAAALNKAIYSLIFLNFFAWFLFAEAVKIDAIFLNRLFFFFATLMVVQFFISLNQRLELISLNFPFIPMQGQMEDFDFRSLGYTINKVRNWGTLSNFEAFGEFCSMLFVFSFYLIRKHSEILRNIHVSNYARVISIFSVLNIFLSGTRSSLLIAASIGILTLLATLRRRIISTVTALTICGILIFLIANSGLGGKAGLDTAIYRISMLWSDDEYSSLAERSNRLGTFQLGIDGLRNSSPLIGNGYAFGSDYRLINNLGDEGGQYIDPHNLYLSLPLYGGWIGAILFLLLFSLPLFFQCKRDKGFFTAFKLLWFVFLLNQIKIQFIRDPHYMMVIFILLGITYSYYHSCRNGDLA